MRRVSLSKYVAAFSMTVLIFISGIFLGQFIGGKKINEQIKIQNEARLNLLGLNIQSNIIKENLCSADIFSLTEDRFEVGRNVESLEKILGKQHNEVRSLKEEYVLLSVNQWLLVDKYKEECNNDLNIILYFYSNEGDESEKISEEQGYVLDYIYKNGNKSIVIYAIDYDIDNIAIETLKKMYNVTITPTLIIDGEKYIGLHDRKDLENILRID